jgi:hypothetical protein
MKYTVEMASECMIYIPSFMKIGSGIHVILRLLHRQFEATVSVLLMGRIYDACH